MSGALCISRAGTGFDAYLSLDEFPASPADRRLRPGADLFRIVGIVVDDPAGDGIHNRKNRRTRVSIK